MEKGPLESKFSKNLSTENKYKYAIQVLFDNNFHTQSAEVLEKIGFTHAVLKKRLVEKHNMKGAKLDSFFIDKSKKISIKKCGNCVLDYVWSQVKDKRCFKTYYYDKLKDEILRFVDEPTVGISTFELVDWVKTHSNVSIHAFDARCQTFYTYSTSHTNIALCYIVKDYHLHQILDKQLKRAVLFQNHLQGIMK